MEYTITLSAEEIGVLIGILDRHVNLLVKQPLTRETVRENLALQVIMVQLLAIAEQEVSRQKKEREQG